MNLEITLTEVTDDSHMINTARTTVGKEGLAKTEASEEFKASMYLAEHSPIRTKLFSVVIKNVPSWLATHFVRHKIGVEPFVSTQRDDRNPEVINRDGRPQGALVTLQYFLNAQAFINISRVRLCNGAHIQAQELWGQVIEKLRELEPTLARACVPDCIYRGWCFEVDSCRYHTSTAHQVALYEYRKGINEPRQGGSNTSKQEQES